MASERINFLRVKKRDAAIVIGSAFVMAGIQICRIYGDDLFSAPATQEPTFDNPMLAAQTDACLQGARHSNFYLDTKRNSTQTKALGALAAWAGNCLTQNPANQTSADKDKQLSLLRVAFADTDGRAKDIVEEVFDRITSGDLPIAEIRSKDAAAFAVLNAALQAQHDKNNFSSWEETRRAPLPREVKIIPPANPPHVRLGVTPKEISDMARVCNAEAGSILHPDGVRSCAAIIFNRLATGRFGATVDEIIRTGGFEVIQGKGINGLPPASERSLALVNDVIENRRTYGGAIFFENSRVTDARGTNFGTAVAKTGTVGDRNSWIFHDLFRGSMTLSSGVVHIYQVPPYTIEIEDRPAQQERPHSAALKRGYQFALK